MTQFLHPHPFLDEALKRRPRRNRQTAAIRTLIAETSLEPRQLIAPLFLLEGENFSQPILSLPDVSRMTVDLAVRKAKTLQSLGIQAVLLFPVVGKEQKDRSASEAVREGNLLARAIREIKDSCPELCVFADIALDPFTDHGHDGLIDEQGEVLNDETLEILSKMSILCAQAGVDMVAPSDMMDGRVAFIRRALDEAGFTSVGIVSYAAKYASSLYGPFRDALSSHPIGHKKSYQLNPANCREALLEASLDEAEGADMLVVKPALFYLDVLTKIRQQTPLPLLAYHVTGEYAMILAVAQKGWIHADRCFLEAFISIRRAGADGIITYAAERVAKLLQHDFIANAHF